MKKTIVLEARFSAAHFYHQPAWSAEKNQDQFGRCFTKYGHGHNYRVKTQWSDVPISKYESLRQQYLSVIKVLDHEHLNFVVPEFQKKIPTTENICAYLVEKLKGKISYPLISLELFEDFDIGSRFEKA